MNHTLLHRGKRRQDLPCMPKSLIEAARNGTGVASAQSAIAMNALTTAPDAMRKTTYGRRFGIQRLRQRTEHLKAQVRRKCDAPAWPLFRAHDRDHGRRRVHRSARSPACSVPSHAH